jgi:hypothetical protein
MDSIKAREAFATYRLARLPACGVDRKQWSEDIIDHFGVGYHLARKVALAHKAFHRSILRTAGPQKTKNYHSKGGGYQVKWTMAL